MDAVADTDGEMALFGWVDRVWPQRGLRVHGGCALAHEGGLRFAFYGRMSTREFQDPRSSARWQRDFAEDLIVGHGRVVTDFVDVGVSRRIPWPQRPRAAALLEVLADPDRGFDAIVIGEFARAFCADQFTRVLLVFDPHAVPVWLPEFDGPVDGDDPAHQALMMLLGADSRREVQRSRYRVSAAMAVQACEQGRYLGGRPPYGYRLVDAGPHPNRAHARWGRRLYRLDPNPITAGHVQWIFTQRLAGHSTASIARTLNEREVACPSQADPGRNRHRGGRVWTLRTVAAILSNPRYTGRQVWNRQHRERNLPGVDPGGVPAGMRRWNGAQQWVISTELAHPALVSERDFVAAQAISATPGPRDGSRQCYQFTGLLRCRFCGRRMEGHWVHGRPGYRCRHGRTSATTLSGEPGKMLYLREDTILARITTAPLTDAAARHGHTATLGPEAVDYLCANDIVLVCDAETCTIEASQNGGGRRSRGG